MHGIFRCTQNNKLFSVVSQKRTRRYEKDFAETRELWKKQRKNVFFAIKSVWNSENVFFDQESDAMNTKCPILQAKSDATNAGRPILQQRVSKVTWLWTLLHHGILYSVRWGGWPHHGISPTVPCRRCHGRGCQQTNSFVDILHKTLCFCDKRILSQQMGLLQEYWRIECPVKFLLFPIILRNIIFQNLNISSMLCPRYQMHKQWSVILIDNNSNICYIIIGNSWDVTLEH